jgi:hypothetical protein
VFSYFRVFVILLNSPIIVDPSSPRYVVSVASIPNHQGTALMAKKKPATAKPKPTGRIVLRTGEALVEADQAWSAAEPEVVIGELDGPVGYAIANLLGDQIKGHSRVFAILNCDVQVRPTTLMVSKVTVDNVKYTNILMGTVQLSTPTSSSRRIAPPPPRRFTRPCTTSRRSTGCWRTRIRSRTASTRWR